MYVALSWFVNLYEKHNLKKKKKIANPLNISENKKEIYSKTLHV